MDLTLEEALNPNTSGDRLREMSIATTDEELFEFWDYLRSLG
ncbi:MAG: hypothetical protein QNJ54_02580 [Prochloraceae cyanobacterium]|nr:hypothetical protein [Prochloraceae cyanobacterium]